MVSRQPGPLEQEVMDLIGENNLLKWDIIRPEALHQIHHLTERHVAVVITLDKKHRGFPRGDGGHW